MDLGSMSEEFSIDDRGDNGGISRGIESCGICSGFVMDRGVLDCCDHWFCFSCIDNWAGITNICPMCKNEFQLITCVPVFDTIGNNMIEEDSFLRDDDWSIQGENNTLSFPSYYIDENAVICLDGDGCKIRTGAAEMENNSLLDTSIACDSCDLWYHAFCVDFVAEATSESSWLCPRCVSNKEDRTPNTVAQDPGEMGVDGEAKGGGMPEASFNGKVSITVVDAGETAVVVSMVDGEPKAASSLNSMQPTLLHKPMEFSKRYMENKSGVETRENSHEAASAIAFQKEIMPPTNRLISHTPEDPIHSLMSSPGEVHLSSNIDFYEENSVDLTLYENATGNSPSMEQVTGGNNHQFSSKGPLLSSDMSTSQTNLSKKAVELEKPEIRTSKRKYLEYISDDDYEVKGKDDEVENENSAKKCGSNRSNRKLIQHQSSDVDAQLEFTSARKSTLPDIMNIVREGKRHCKGSESHKSAGETSEGKENMNGLRVKKIMRRAVEDKDSSSAVQKLRQEIKEAMQSKTSISENDLVNEKLLTAFRAAIAGPGNGHMMKNSSTALKSKNPILQKGRARENLTRKIYATGTGRRRRAWDREREVEFWKHRCMHTGPEKVETLKSVLDLLKRSSDSGISGHEKNRSDIDGKDSILSRLYLADASVFPRKEDIKPVAVLPNQDKGVEQENTSLKDSCPVQEDSKTVSRRDKDIKVDCLSNLKNVKNSYSSKAQGSGIPNTHSKGSSTSGLPKQHPAKSTGSLVDKKKWALEVLARKNASTNKGSENQEDNAKLKGNYPLLAQLPSDMRPEIIIIPRCKVPLSIRQPQLYRLTELFLSKTNMPVIRRTAETELAIADAVNVEKEICEKANSKSVYRNLCSLTMSRHKSVKEPIKDDKEREAGNVVVPCDIVEKALKLAGLDSDSPPSSPDVTNDTEKNENCNLKNESETHGSIFDLDPQSDFDIYGDFEYDLDDDVYAGSIEGTNTSKSVKESDLKIKVVLSKVPLKAPDTANHKLEHVGEKNSSCMVELKSLNSDPHAECQANSSEKNEEISLADYQDLYGMEKEPLSNQYVFDAPIVETIKSAAEINRNAENGIKKQTVVNKSACDNFCMEESVSENMISKATNVVRDKQSDFTHSVSNKVEAYVKEHIRPLCKSGVISVEQYRWAVAKTTEKVMKFHLKEKNANFLIKEGDKVKKLAEQYVEASQEKK